MDTYTDIPGTTRHDIDVGHSTMSYQKVGTGPTLLFVHGWPLNGNTWRHVVPYLDGYTCYIVDLPGTGQSKATSASPITVRGHADAVVAMIDGLGLDQVTLVGQDSGGMVCRFAADQRPHAVTSLSMCGTEIPGLHTPLIRLLTATAKLPFAASMFKAIMSSRVLARSPLAFGGTVYDKSLLDGEMRDNLLGPIVQDDDAIAGLTAMIRDFTGKDVDALEDVHGRLTMPVLLVWGEDDPFFPVEKARAMTSQFAGPTEFEVIAKCKLLVHEEYPQRFAELTAAFLANHDLGAAMT